MKTILVADDQELTRDLVRAVLSTNPAYQVHDAVNGADAAQSFDLAAGAAFAALGGAPPVAKYVAVVREQVVMANVSGAPQRVQFSAIDNAADWTVSAITQSDYNDLAGDHGETRLILRELRRIAAAQFDQLGV